MHQEACLSAIDPILSKPASTHAVSSESEAARQDQLAAFLGSDEFDATVTACFARAVRAALSGEAVEKVPRGS
jgi:hypothetical protein